MHSPLHASIRAALPAVLVGALGLVMPRAARGQTVSPEQALLNRFEAAPSSGVVTASSHVAAAPAAAPNSVDGARALMNRSGPVHTRPAQGPEHGQAAFAHAPSADGVRALLNRRTL